MLHKCRVQPMKASKAHTSPHNSLCLRLPPTPLPSPHSPRKRRTRARQFNKSIMFYQRWESESFILEVHGWNVDIRYVSREWSAIFDSTLQYAAQIWFLSHFEDSNESKLNDKLFPSSAKAMEFHRFHRFECFNVNIHALIVLGHFLFDIHINIYIKEK